MDSLIARPKPLYRLSKRRVLLLLSLISLTIFPALVSASVEVITAKDASPREKYGAERIRAALADMPSLSASQGKILVAVRDSSLLANYELPHFWPGATEAFALRKTGSVWIVTGSDASGTLYGSLELINRIHATGGLPSELNFEDHPLLRLRGTCIGMQKTEITYEGGEYDYPYTPKDFPFFYDKGAWAKYLDFLVDNRMNTLYLWNGHPFTSLLKLSKYPEAQELPDAQLEQNIELFRWLTQEADRRGIWVVQGFYNIHLSHAFARAHNLPYHLSAPNPVAGEYTRYAISEFIRQYPNVGLLMTLGEALSPKFGAEWLSQTIIPGVKDGLREIGSTTEPPLVVRAHATDIDAVMAAAKPLYHNIDTMQKWTGESLTWFNERGKVLEKTSNLTNLASVDIANVHILANLEPFRWGSPDYIRKCILSFQKIGIGGLHLYPLRYWDWPYSADNTQPLLQQTDRDWIWFEAWARYAWNPNRDPAAEQNYWAARIGERYGSNQAGVKLLAAYELSGICAPKLLPRIGITEGNRQAFALGMLMPQLIDANRYGPAEDLWTGDAPPGERLYDYVQKEWLHLPHQGETPIEVAAEATDSATKAVKAAEEAGPYVTRNRDEYERFLNDVRAIYSLMQYYQAKTQAAELVMLYGYDRQRVHLEEAEKLLAGSVDFYRQLLSLTDKTYRQGTSLHTAQRQIPFPGAPGKYTHWRDCLPVYEQELTIFRERLRWLDAQGPMPAASPHLAAVPFHLTTDSAEADTPQTFQVEAGARLFTDADATVSRLIPELQGLTGIRISREQANGHGVPLHITLDQPAEVLIGFYKTSSRKYRPADPKTEDWHLQAINGVEANGNPALSVWSKPLPAGKNDLDLGKGAYVVLGFIPRNTTLVTHLGFFGESQAARPPDLDWLFEN